MTRSLISCSGSPRVNQKWHAGLVRSTGSGSAAQLLSGLAVRRSAGRAQRAANHGVVSIWPVWRLDRGGYGGSHPQAERARGRSVLDTDEQYLDYLRLFAHATRAAMRASFFLVENPFPRLGALLGQDMEGNALSTQPA